MGTMRGGCGEDAGRMRGGPRRVRGGPGRMRGGSGRMRGGSGRMRGGPGRMRRGPGRMRGGSGRMRGGPARMRGGSESSQGSETEPLDDPTHSHRSHCILQCPLRLAYRPSPCICVQQPASTSMREALLLSTCHRKQPNQAPLCRVLPRAQTPTQQRPERRSINTHAAAKRTPPRCMHHLPLVTAHTVRSHKVHASTHSAPVSAQVHTDIKNVQSHL